jgi:hypothetical protein
MVRRTETGWLSETRQVEKGRPFVIKLAGGAVGCRLLKRWLGDPVNRKMVRRMNKAGVNFTIL